MSEFPAKTDVLIVGAGPTGLALAASLAQAGVDHVLIDKLAAGQSTSRAAVIHAHTLEALETLGVADRLSDTGFKLTRFSIRDRDRTLVQLGFDALPSKFSYLLMTPQDTTERVLAERHQELGGRIHRGVVAERLSSTMITSGPGCVTPTLSARSTHVTSSVPTACTRLCAKAPVSISMARNTLTRSCSPT